MQVNAETATRADTLESLIVSSTRLTRMGARISGNTVSSAAWAALSVLHSEGPHRTGDLARAARISQPGMTKVVQTLVADEWVLRTSDAADSRATLIAISDSGREALAERRRQLADALADTFSLLTDSEWNILDRAANILAAHTVISAKDIPTKAIPTKEEKAV